jgi:hypothetical protein
MQHAASTIEKKETICSTLIALIIKHVSAPDFSNGKSPFGDK